MQIVDEATTDSGTRGQLERERAVAEKPGAVKAAFLRVLAKIRRAEDGQKLWVVHEAQESIGRR